MSVRLLHAHGSYVLEDDCETHSICYGPNADEDAVEVVEAVNERRVRRAGLKSTACGCGPNPQNILKSSVPREQVATAWGTFSLAEIDDAS